MYKIKKNKWFFQLLVNIAVLITFIYTIYAIYYTWTEWIVWFIVLLIISGHIWNIVENFASDYEYIYINNFIKYIF